jgi:hypothetical protein
MTEGTDKSVLTPGEFVGFAKVVLALMQNDRLDSARNMAQQLAEANIRTHVNRVVNDSPYGMDTPLLVGSFEYEEAWGIVKAVLQAL